MSPILRLNHIVGRLTSIRQTQWDNSLMGEIGLSILQVEGELSVQAFCGDEKAYEALLMVRNADTAIRMRYRRKVIAAFSAAIEALQTT